jgi:hypothetical protein
MNSLVLMILNKDIELHQHFVIVIYRNLNLTLILFTIFI